MAQSGSNTGRLAFIDWTRGLAALIMLQGHTFHSFTRTDLRDKGPYMLSQFVGGLPPAMFLFLTGITFSFLMDSQERKSLGAWARWIGALKRARYLFILAVLFRLSAYVFGYPTSPASELLRVDILNCMGFSMLLLSPLALLSTAARIRWCSLIGLGIAFLSPVLSAINFSGSGIPPFLLNYVIPTYNTFGFFPWAAFLSFGMVVGSVIRVVKAADLERAMLWTLGLGIAIILGARSFAAMPYTFYPAVDFWLDSPGLTTIKLGILLVLLAVAYLWGMTGVFNRWNLVRQLGTTSLLVYWVHIELVYGRWFGAWKEKLSYGGVVTYTLCLIALMVLLSVGQTSGRLRIPRWRFSSERATLPLTSPRYEESLK